MNTLTLNAWGAEHSISFRLANYAENNNLYVGMITHDEEWPEPWSDLTVNLGVKLEPNIAFIDVNDNGWQIIDWLIENNLGQPTTLEMISGFCTYPEFEFNMPELMKYMSCDERIAIEEEL